MVKGSDTVQSLRREGILQLQQAGIESPAADAGLLLMHALRIDKTHMLTSDAAVDGKRAEVFRALLRRRAEGEPVQYLLGKCEFMSLEFEVSRDTLIPRADTETLIEWVLRRESAERRPLRILDVGTGSGCIALSLAHYLPDAHVVGLDISAGALRVAARNARRLELHTRAEFLQWDIRSGFPPQEEKFDYIVSNPPYIPAAELPDLQREVREYEPRSALCGGADGLDFYRVLAGGAAFALKAGGALAVEVGFGQAAPVRELFRSAEGLIPDAICRDLAGVERVVTALRA